MEKESKDSVHIKIDKDIKEYLSKLDGKEYPDIACFHTYGMNRYNNQRELCVVIDINEDIVIKFLMSMIDKVFKGKTVYTEGIRNDILTKERDTEFISFKDDPMLYIILPDRNGRLPSDADCAEPYKFQYEYAKRLSDDYKEKLLNLAS